MSDTDLPEDLLDLERARVHARRELDTSVCTIEIQQRAAWPDPEHIVQRRVWAEEQTAHWQQLRAAYRRAVETLRAHPVLAAAATEGRLWKVEEQLRAQVPQVQVVVRRREDGTEHVVTLVNGVEEGAATGVAAA